MHPTRIFSFGGLALLLFGSLSLTSCEIIKPMLQPLPSYDREEQISEEHSISPESNYRPNPPRSNPPRVLQSRNRAAWNWPEESVSEMTEEPADAHISPKPRTRGGLFVPQRSRRTDYGGLPGTLPPTHIMSREYQQRDQVIKYAFQLQGTTYTEAGDNPQEGFDCSGFTCYVYEQANIQLPRVSAMQAGQGVSKELLETEPGDLIFFRKPDTNRVFHVAVVVANEPNGIRVIHSTSTGGVRIDNITQSSYWQQFPMEARDILGEGR